VTIPGAEEVIRQQCQLWVNEASALRIFQRPGPAAPPGEVHSRLLEARGKLDRLEAILAEITAYRASMKARARQLEQDADDAYDKELDQLARAGVRRDYEGAQERYAQARLAALPQRQRSRTAQRAADLVASNEEVVRGMFRGLRDVREELLASLRYLQWENQLARP
jgi:conjugal transfer/entry exclusion protein